MMMRGVDREQVSELLNHAEDLGQNRQTKNPGDWDNSHDKITAMRILGASGEMVFNTVAN